MYIWELLFGSAYPVTMAYLLAHQSWQQVGPTDRISIAASLAHEIGHAFVFDCLTARELREVASRFGGWDFSPSERESKLDFYDQQFFVRRPSLPALSQLGAVAQKEQKTVLRANSIVSQYALTNAHEWFAEAFAARILQVLGERGHFGSSWHEHLARPANPAGEDWVDYVNLAPALNRWLDERLRKAS